MYWGRGAIQAHFAGKNYGALKSEVADVVIETLRPIRGRYAQLLADPGELDCLLAIGVEQARAVAEPRIAQMMERVGFLPPCG